MNTSFFELLSPERLTEFVDVGANPVDGDPPYKPMLDAGLCRVTGLEPQPEALLELQRAPAPNARYLPYAVGDGNMHTLNICRASGMTSLLEPDAQTLELFEYLKPLGGIASRIPVQTVRLDDIAEISVVDCLKIDIQGGELAVFQSGAARLAQAVAIQTEVSFVPLYKNQPCLGDIDLELRRQGFMPHCFDSVKLWPIAPCVIKGDPREPLRQLLEADMVYVRDFSRPDMMSNEQLKHLALIVHYCYGSIDLALRCVMLLEQRNVFRSGAQQHYLQHCLE